MKTPTLLLTFFLCAALLSFGQSNITVPNNKSVRKDVPERIRNSNQYKRADWFTSQRAFPFDTIPVSRYYQELDREMVKVKSARLKSNDYPTWTPIGPGGILSNIQSYRTVSGRVRALAVHPADPQTVYIGAASGGLWKTTNGGANWADIGYGFESLTYGAIAIDPKNPEVIYAGSGESILAKYYQIYPGKGLFKSTDGGRSWIVITNGIGIPTQFSDLAVSPHNSNMVIASLASGNAFLGFTRPNEGIWRSLDGGITWNRTLSLEDPFDIGFHPTNPNIVYAAVGGMTTMAGFYISEDQGATWVQSNSGLQLATSGGRMQFDISQSDPDIIYAVIFDANNSPDGNGVSRAYKSVNGGKSWNQISVGSPLGGSDGVTWTDQGWYDLCIAVDPIDPDHVLIGNIELHRTTDGLSFSPVRPFGTNFYGSLVHMDYHKLVYAPSNPGILYIGCDGGVYKSTDRGYTATSQNRGLRTLQFHRIASHPSNSRILMGGMQDNCSAITTNGGTSWTGIFQADGMDCFFDRINPDQVLYGTLQNGRLLKSWDRGATYTRLFDVKGAFLTPFFMHPTNNSILYTANTKVLKSTDAGASFQVISGPTDVSPAKISSLAQSQVNPNTMIFASGHDQAMIDAPIVLKVSTDEGLHWTDVTTKVPGEIRCISRVVTDPVDSNTLYIVRTGFSPGNKVWKSNDLGQNWTNTSGDLPDLPCNDLFIDPENTSHLFMATDIGVYLSLNGGATWNYASEGMPVVPVMDFDYVKIGNNRYLRAGTYGRSVYETKFTRSCQLENVTFSSQAEIDNFQTGYPLCEQIRGDVTISGSDISNLNGLSCLTSIGGNLTIGYASDVNPSLLNLSGLEGVTFIGGNLIIEHNSKLNNLTALESLETIGGDLVIRNNDVLAELKGLKNIDSGSIFNLTIRDNDSLSACEVRSICDYLARPNGNIDIQNNAIGCNSQVEVEKACLTSSKVFGMENELSIFPNPGKGLLVISAPKELIIDRFAMYTASGQQLHQGKLVDNMVDISKLRPGLYFIEIQVKKLTVRKKFIVE